MTNIYINSIFVGRLIRREVYLVLVGSDGGEEVEHRTEVIGKVNRRHPWMPAAPIPLIALENGFRGTLVVMDSDEAGRDLADRMMRVEGMVREHNLLSTLWAAAGPAGGALAKLGGAVAQALSSNADDVLATFEIDVEIDPDEPPGEVVTLTKGHGRRRIAVELGIGERASQVFGTTEEFGLGPATTGVRAFDHLNLEDFLDAHLELAARVEVLERARLEQTNPPPVNLPAPGQYVALETWPLDPKQWNPDTTVLLRTSDDDWLEVQPKADGQAWEWMDRRVPVMPVSGEHDGSLCVLLP